MSKLSGSAWLDKILNIADKSSQDTAYRAMALDWLNLIVADIANRQTNFHWKFLEKTATANTVANQHSYDLPSDIDGFKIIAIYDRTNDVTYTYVPYELFVRRVADPSASTGGNVVWWTYFADTIRLFPVPDSVWTFYLDYVKLPSEYTDSSSSQIEIPGKYNKVIMDGVLTYVYKFDPTLGDQVAQTQIYEAGIVRMIQDNEQTIAEATQPISHRVKYAAAGEVDGKNSILFPLDSTSM